MSPEADIGSKKRVPARKTASLKRVAPSRAKRKAPTPVRATVKKSSVSYKFISIVFVACAIVSALSVYIGTRDKGPINVSATMAERAAIEASKGNTALSETIKTAGRSQTVSRTDDGLVGAGNKVTEQQKQKKPEISPAPENTASSTASSTNATSTDDVFDENDQEDTDAASEDESADNLEESSAEDAPSDPVENQEDEEQSDESMDDPEEDSSTPDQQDGA